MSNKHSALQRKTMGLQDILEQLESTYTKRAFLNNIYEPGKNKSVTRALMNLYSNDSFKLMQIYREEIKVAKTIGDNVLAEELLFKLLIDKNGLYKFGVDKDLRNDSIISKAVNYYINKSDVCAADVLLKLVEKPSDLNQTQRKRIDDAYLSRIKRELRKQGSDSYNLRIYHAAFSYLGKLKNPQKAIDMLLYDTRKDTRKMRAGKITDFFENYFHAFKIAQEHAPMRLKEIAAIALPYIKKEDPTILSAHIQLALGNIREAKKQAEGYFTNILKENSTRQPLGISELQTEWFGPAEIFQISKKLKIAIYDASINNSRGNYRVDRGELSLRAFHATGKTKFLEQAVREFESYGDLNNVREVTQLLVDKGKIAYQRKVEAYDTALNLMRHHKIRQGDNKE